MDKVNIKNHLLMYKIILFSMAMVLFLVGGAKIARADGVSRVYIITDENGDAVTLDQIQNKQIRFTFETNGHDEGPNPDDGGYDFHSYYTAYNEPWASANGIKFKRPLIGTAQLNTTITFGAKGNDVLWLHDSYPTPPYRTAEMDKLCRQAKAYLQSHGGLSRDISTINEYLALTDFTKRWYGGRNLAAALQKALVCLCTVDQFGTNSHQSEIYNVTCQVNGISKSVSTQCIVNNMWDNWVYIVKATGINHTHVVHNDPNQKPADHTFLHSVTSGEPLSKVDENIFEYTVTNDYADATVTFVQCIHFQTDYKHTTLTLNPNGGSISGNTGAQALSPKLQYSTSEWNNLSTKKPSQTGYTFTGWYDAASDGTKVYNADGTCVKGTKYFDSNGKSLMTSDVTLYAQWSINKYHIYYTLYGSSASVKRAYTITDNAFTLPTPSLNGYTFKGWIGGIDKKDPVRDANGKTYASATQSITIPRPVISLYGVL